MSNSKRKCAYCKQSKKAEEGYIHGLQFFCDKYHFIEYASKNVKKLADKQRAKLTKEYNAETRRRKKSLRSRNDWFDILQDLVNQYVLHVRDKDKPCYTCGTNKRDIKYDAGHGRSRGACPELRFELTNIHKQCSMNCNQIGTGKWAEYKEALIAEYGQEHFDWLVGPHPTLKEQFPDIESIEKKIKRYRTLIRESGLTPRR